MNKRTQIRTSLEDENGLPDINALGSDTQILDISAFGACILTSKMLELGKRVSFHLNLSDMDENVSFIAEVKWRKPAENNKYKIGLQFIS